MQIYNGSCHCGKVKYNFKIEKITKTLRCNCSICIRLGALLSPWFPFDDLQVTQGKETLKIYLWNDKEIEFTFCGNCGVPVFYAPADRPGQCRVNLNCVENLNLETLDIVHYDGRTLL